MANTKNLVVLLTSMLIAGSAYSWDGFSGLQSRAALFKAVGIHNTQSHLKTAFLAVAVPTYLAGRYDVLGKAWRTCAPQKVQDTVNQTVDAFNKQSTAVKLAEVGSAAGTLFATALIVRYIANRKSSEPKA